ncbi:hypothetical protein EsDP_00001539 [Epichloe bromicola]|uniref:Thioredoxin n=1 Tax=Epichloe bromicola TaxID=79588 RepID=A0ABQ0CI48_9HYPO
MSVINITSKAQFDELLKEKPAVALQAHAVWCGPCKTISPVFEKIASEGNNDAKVTFARFDTDEVSDLAQELGVRSIPAFFAFKNGEKVDNLAGANPPALQKLVKDLASLGE